jgi:hypothetical protein
MHDVRLDRVEVAEALHAVLVAQAACREAADARADAADHARQGWEGRSRAAFDGEHERLLGQLEEGAASLGRLQRRLVELVEAADALQADVEARRARRRREQVDLAT